MIGAYIAATVVTLVQYLRTRDRRLLLLVALFAFQAQALSREWFDVWKDVYQGLACAAGVTMVVVMTLRLRPAANATPKAPASAPSGQRADAGAPLPH